MAHDAAPRRRWLNLAEAATYTGFSPKTLRRRIADGSLKGYRAGPREIRLDAQELDGLFQRIPSARGGGRLAG